MLSVLVTCKAVTGIDKEEESQIIVVSNEMESADHREKVQMAKLERHR